MFSLITRRTVGKVRMLNVWAKAVTSVWLKPFIYLELFLAPGSIPWNVVVVVISAQKRRYASNKPVRSHANWTCLNNASPPHHRPNKLTFPKHQHPPACSLSRKPSLKTAPNFRLSLQNKKIIDEFCGVVFIGIK